MRKKRRAIGEGCVYQAPNGRWRGFISTCAAGAQHKSWISANTQAAALEKLRYNRKRLALGLVNKKTALSAWLDTWLQDCVGETVNNKETV